MKKILKAFIENPTQANERDFESALLNADLFIDRELVIEVENLRYIPVFTSVEDAQSFGVQTEVTHLNRINLGIEDILLINPNDESIEMSALDVDALCGTSLESEVIGEDNKALGLMIKLKTVFEDIDTLTQAWLVSMKIGRHKRSYLVLDGLREDSDAFATILEVMEPYTHTHDVLFASSKDGKTIIKGIKPFYTK